MRNNFSYSDIIHFAIFLIELLSFMYLMSH